MGEGGEGMRRGRGKETVEGRMSRDKGRKRRSVRLRRSKTDSNPPERGRVVSLA